MIATVLSVPFFVLSILIFRSLGTPFTFPALEIYETGVGYQGVYNCNWSTYNARYLWCFPNPKTSYRIAVESNTVVEVSVVDGKRPLGYYIEKWGEPNAVTFVGRMTKFYYIRVWWDDRAVGVFTPKFSPFSIVTSYSYTMEPGGATPWQGFTSYP